MSTPHKKQFFIKSQIPQYIKEEYPLFLEMMEQYYSYLDQDSGKIIAVKVLDGGSGYIPVKPWSGNTTYEKNDRFSWNNKVYSVIESKTSNSITKTFDISSVDGIIDSITFPSQHGLSTGDEVVYSFNGATGPNGATGIIGLRDTETYWVNVSTPTSVKLFSSRAGSLSGSTGLVNLTSTIIPQTHKLTAGPWHSGATGVYTFANITSKYISSGTENPVIVYFLVKGPDGNLINDPKAGSAFGVAAIPVIESGVVKKIVVTNFGLDYTKEQEIQAVVSGGGGSGAVLQCVTTTETDSINSSVASVISSRDIDETVDAFITSLRRELISNIPDKLYTEQDNLVDSREVDVKKFVKFIKQFYKSKGAEKSIQFLFRILFDSDVQIYYPKTDMLRVSDGKWSQNKIIRVSPADVSISEEEFTELYLGEKIIGVTSGVTAFIQSIVDVAISGSSTVFELSLTDITGIFAQEEDVKVFNLDRTFSGPVIARIKPCISSLTIEDGGINYSIGDQINAASSFLARVTEVGTVNGRPKIFDISNVNPEVYKSFNIKDVNSTSETIFFKTPHNYINGEGVKYSFDLSKSGTNKKLVKSFNISADVDYLNDIIIFDDPHTFGIGDRVIYAFDGATGPFGATGPLGLIDEGIYYVSNIIPDASKMVAEINLVSGGTGYISAPNITLTDPFTGATSFIGATGSVIGSTGFSKDSQIKVNFAIAGSTGVSSKFYRATGPVPHNTTVPLHSVGATGYWNFIGRNALAVSTISGGSVNNIVVTDPGFGYGITPSVTFSSGTASAIAKMYSDIPSRIIRLFSSSQSAINGSTGIIPINSTGISQNHKIFLSPIGLKNNFTYYTRITGSTGVQLYRTSSDAIIGATGSLVNLEGTILSDNHALYRNELFANINPANSSITFATPHSFKTGRKVLYSFNGSTGPSGSTGPIGLIDNTEYYIRVLGATGSDPIGATGIQLYSSFAGAKSGATGLVSIGATGLNQLHKLTQISTDSITNYEIQNYGFNYNTQPIFQTTGGEGAVFVGNFSGLITTNGDYIGTDSQPSSSKKIQDSEYYQDYSYEIISDQSARIFGTILEKTIHPAGLRYFSKILSVREESLYGNRDNYNAFYDQYTIFVNSTRTDFDVEELLDNGVEWSSSDTVIQGTKIFVRIETEDYIFLVSSGGQFGNTPPNPNITTEQENGTAKVIFSGVAEQLISVFVNGEKKEYGTDYFMLDANTVRFYVPVKEGSIVRIYRREDTFFPTDYNEYIQKYTTIVIRRNKFVRDSFTAYLWYSGLEINPITWTRNTSYTINQIVEWLGNYYLVVSSGVSGKNPPTHEVGEYPNGTSSFRYYSGFRGYIGDILYYGNNFYKVIGTTNAQISGVFGQTPPTHTSGTAINGKLILNYYDPGFKFWTPSTAVSVNDILLHEGNWYKVIVGGTTGVTGPIHEFGNVLSGTARLEYYTIDHDKVTTIPVVSELDPGKAMLGPTVNDIVRRVDAGVPDYFQSITGSLGVTPSSTIHVVDLGESGLSREKDEYNNYTIIVTFSNGTQAATSVVRRITSYDIETKIVNLDTPITIPNDCTAVSYRILQNYIVSSFNSGTNNVGLSVFDNAYNLNALLTQRSGVTSLSLVQRGLSTNMVPGSTGLVFSGGGGTGAAGFVTLSGNVGSTGVFVSTVTLTNGGSGYTSKPSVVIAGATGFLSPYEISVTDNLIGATSVWTHSFNAATDINATTEVISIPSHGLTTGMRLTYSNNGNANVSGLTNGTIYYVIFVSVNEIKLALSYANAKSGSPINISTGTGTHRLFLQNDVYRFFNIIITSGGGVNSVLNITEYNELTNTITYSGTPSGTIVPGVSTYYIYPDLYPYPTGATGPNGSNYNDDHYSGSIASLLISSPGSGYQITDTISITGGYGFGGSAVITSVDGSGRITGVALTSSGRGYIYEPRITVNSSTGNGSSIFPILTPISSSVGVLDTVSRYSMFGNYIFNVSNVTKQTTGFGGVDLYKVTISPSFDISNLYIGISISGTGIASGARVLDISSNVGATGFFGPVLTLDKPNISSVSGTITFTGKPWPQFEYGETLTQISTENPSIINRSRVIKYDYLNRVLYVEKDELSDELNDINNLIRVRDNSIINIIQGSVGSTGPLNLKTGSMYSGWKSINAPNGCIIKSYPL